jgi:hypothetical protein
MNLEQRITELEQRIAELEKKATAETAAPKSVFIQTCLHVTPFADSQKISQELHRYITESKEDCTERQG